MSATSISDQGTLPSPAPEAWLEVFFTQPGSPSAMEFVGGPAEALKNAIDSARLSIEVAIYNLNLWSIRDALLRAHNRGVVVRMVAESDNLDGEEFQSLVAAGIPVLGDRREGLMHNKFVIIDRMDVWTGSLNFTLNSAFEDDNNLICLHSADAAEDYLAEFEEMFIQDRFGGGGDHPTPHPEVWLGDTRVELLFSPDDGVQRRLLELIDEAGESIRFLAYSFTSDPLGEALRTRAFEGVIVEGVMDAEQAVSNAGTEYEIFIQHGLDVRLDGSDGLMHHKVIILDGRIVIAGSYNFSRSAEEANDENVVIIHNPVIASLFLMELQRVKEQAPAP